MSTVSTQKLFTGRSWLTLYLALLLIAVVAGWFVTGYLGDKARREILEYNESGISLHSSRLTTEFEKTIRAVMLLSGSPWIAPALISQKEQDIENANSTLDRYNLSQNSSVSYLMDSNGMTIASSNRNDSDSFVGKSYQFRPYFTQAIKGTLGRYFALGATSLKRGFYASYPVRESKGEIIGVAVIKKDVDAEEAHLGKYPYCFVVDPNGIIFLSGRKLMNFKSLWPVSRETQIALIKSKQFGEKEFDSILQREVEDGKEITFYGKNYLASRKVINPEGWSIVLMTTTERVLIYKAAGVIITILVCTFIIVPLVISYKTSKSAEIVMESERRYRDLVENATDLICTHDLKGTVLSVNAAAARDTGLAVEEIVGLCFPDVLPQDRRNEFNDYIKTIQSDGTATGTMKIMARNGEVRFWEYRNTLRTEGVPEPVVRGMARDVTGEVLAKRALKKSEKKYRQLFERNLAGVYRSTIDGRLLDCNDAFARIYGYESREEAMQHKAMDLHVSPKARQEYIATLQARGMLLDFEIQGRRKDGSLIWLLQNVTLVHGEEDGLTEMDGTLVDITDRKRAEEALRESEKKYRNILENIEDGYFEVDTAGNFTFFNDSTCRILGYSADELKGMNNREYTDDKNAKKIFKVFNEVYRTGISTKIFDWELIRKDGSKCFVETVVSLITDSNKVKTGFRGIARDISERKRSEEELDNSFKQLRVALGGTIQALAVAVETRDPYTAGHQKRVADLSRAIATEMGLDINRTDGLRMAGVIHDLGKMAVPAEILSKPSRLSAIEYNLIKIHPQAGYDILKDVEFPWPIAQIVLQHHERLDGSGYPDGLKGDEILLEARIIAVADVVEAIASNRPYRPGLGMEKALGEITQNRGILYDPAAVDACLRLFSEKGYKFV
jgi:PAS domain S-box-containing protein